MDKTEKFLKLADEVADITESDRWTAEPWPEWFQNVVMRMVRVFIPTLKRGDFKNKRERLEGYGLAFMSELAEEVTNIDTSKFPKKPLFAALKRELRSIETEEGKKINRALHAAVDLPAEQRKDFWSAYSDGRKKRSFHMAMQRLRDNQTAQICLFLMSMRPFIEDKKIPTVSALFENFMQIKQAFPGQKVFFLNNPNARRSLEQHFRKICTEDKVKLAGRGQPRRNKGSGSVSR
jgi:hypothetical protein